MYVGISTTNEYVSGAASGCKYDDYSHVREAAKYRNMEH